jgi:glycosyltransferase involved in cell wall biosynthesis
MQPHQEQYDFCVLIPCFNNFGGLVESLNSINYPLAKYIALIVDDGSKPSITMQALRANLKQTLKIHIIQLKENRGITHALNTGLKWIEETIKTKYIARLDCSDICAPQRFYEQVSYLENNPRVGLVGSWCYFKEENTSFSYAYTTPTVYEEIKKAMYFRNVFIHPTVMFRTEVLKKVGYYLYNYPHAEDYAFFWKMIFVTEAVVLNQFLMTCALNRKGISFSNRREQLVSRKKVIADFGRNVFLKWAGYTKIKVLMLMPYELILKLKNRKA